MMIKNTGERYKHAGDVWGPEHRPLELAPELLKNAKRSTMGTNLRDDGLADGDFHDAETILN